jgi:hypothetical protein
VRPRAPHSCPQSEGRVVGLFTASPLAGPIF